MVCILKVNLIPLWPSDTVYSLHRKKAKFQHEWINRFWFVVYVNTFIYLLTNKKNVLLLWLRKYIGNILEAWRHSKGKKFSIRISNSNSLSWNIQKSQVYYDNYKDHSIDWLNQGSNEYAFHWKSMVWITVQQQFTMGLSVWFPVGFRLSRIHLLIFEILTLSYLLVVHHHISLHLIHCNPLERIIESLLFCNWISISINI